MAVKLSLPVKLGFVLWEIWDKSLKFVAAHVACFGCLLGGDGVSRLLDCDI